MVTIYFKLADIKLESFEAYLLKFRKAVEGFRKYLHFFVKMQFQMPISRMFHIYNKINNIFLKFHHYYFT